MFVGDLRNDLHADGVRTVHAARHVATDWFTPELVWVFTDNHIDQIHQRQVMLLCFLHTYQLSEPECVVSNVNIIIALAPSR